MKRAVCVLIDSPGRGGEYLAVTRKSDALKIGLPGGKVDPGESEIDAIVRETFEETGLKLEPDHLVPIYSSLCPGDVNFWVTTFYYHGTPLLFSELREKELGVRPLFVFLSQLMDPKHSPFAAYNCGVAGAVAHYKLLGTK